MEARQQTAAPPPGPPSEPPTNPSKARAPFRIGDTLSKTEAKRIGLALKAMALTEGWQVTQELLQRSVAQMAINSLHDGSRPREYYAGVLDGLEAFLGSIQQMIGDAEVVEEKDKAKELGEAVKVIQGVFGRPGGGSPAE